MATVEQKEASAEVHGRKLIQAEASKRWDFATGSHERILRNLSSDKYRPSLQKIELAMNKLRSQSKKFKLQDD